MTKINIKHNSYYRSIARNMLLAIIIVSLTPMFVVSGFILCQFHRSYEQKAYDHLETLVKKHQQNIDAFLKEKLAQIKFVANTFTFEELANQSFLEDLLANLQTEHGPVFVDLGVIDSQGLQVAYAGPFKLTQAMYASADWFHKAMRREFHISDVFLGLRLMPHFIVAVKDNYNGKPWILRATIDFVAFNNLVERIRIGQTGFAFILNHKGEFQTRPFQEVNLEKGPYIELLQRQHMNEKEIQIVTMTGESGDENIFISALLKDGEWWMVYSQSVSDAFADFNLALKVTLAIILLSGLCIVSMAFFVSRRMISRIAKADIEKRRMNDQIIETGKLASVGELAAGIAHEINNPVAIMVEEAGWIEDLLEDETFKDGENLQEFRRALEQIRNQGRRCKEITHKLLSFARKTDAKIQEVRLNELIEELVALSQQRAKFNNVRIETDFEENLPTLEVSQSELQQVFLNLVNNAFDAMEKHGGRLKITTSRSDDKIQVEVSDNGPGIPQANLPRIFDPFFTTKPVGKGTGLGLSICYGIINKLGGNLEVRSSLGKGTTFTVDLPISLALTEEANESGT